MSQLSDGLSKPGPEDGFPLPRGRIDADAAQPSARNGVPSLREHLLAHLDNTPLAVLEWDQDVRLQLWSGRATDLFGFDESDVIGRAWNELGLVPEEDLAAVGALIEALRSGRRHRAMFGARNRHKDGHLLHCEWYVSALHEPDGRVASILMLVQDVTPRAELERQVRQAQRLEAVGHLADAIAHDFNNMITAIHGFTERARLALEDRAPDLHEARDSIQHVHHAAGQAAALARQLLSYTRRSSSSVEVVDPNAVIARLERMLRPTLGQGIQLRVDCAPDIARVRIECAQLEQLLMNLIINARESMPDGGTLTIATENSGFQAAQGATDGDPSALPRFVQLSVADTGSGMQPDTVARAFDAHFTTKTADYRLGLGLSIVRDIVAAAGGRITVDTSPIRGTTFRVDLPSVAPQAAEVSPSAPSAEARGGRETILVCEDDGAVRQLMKAALTRWGYRVLIADCGAAAMSQVVNYDGTIDLLVTDVVMPACNGRELAQKLSTMIPGLRVLYVSGFAADTVSGYGILPAEANLLEKPFTTIELAERVRATLDQRITA